MSEMYTQADGIIMNNKLSVILRCRNEDRWIGHSLQSIFDHLNEPEVIIVNNNSNDESMEIVRMFQKWHTVKKINIDDYSPGRSLNLGFQNASNDNVLVFSAHCVLKSINQSHLDHLNTYAAVFGKQIPIYKGRRIKTRYVWENFMDDKKENPWAKNENRHFLHNAMCLYRKKFVLDNPFDEDLYGKEDRYWAKDMIENNHKIMYDPSMICDHHWTNNGATWKGLG